jgi:hypothetical protein
MNAKKLTGDISKTGLAKLCSELKASDFIQIAIDPTCDERVRESVQIIHAKARNQNAGNSSPKRCSAYNGLQHQRSI